MNKISLFLLGAPAALLLAAAALYRPLIRPWHLRWGATDAEVRLPLAGDEIVASGALQSTRAIDVHAPAARVWPWLLQLGQGRGGLFSYDALENLVGCNIHTLDWIDPALQSLAAGDTLRIGQQEGLPTYQVALLEPGRALVLRAVDPATGQLTQATWGFYLIETSPTHTRLIIRHRDQPAQGAATRVINAVFEPISFVMERRMLYGLKAHGELDPVHAKPND
jgi:hypothetical protein